MKGTFEPKNPLPPNVQKCLEIFGHLPSIEAMKFMKPEELDKQAKEANEKGEPIQEWKDRPNRETGTILDDLDKK